MRVIKKFEELEQTPHGTVIRSNVGRVYERWGNRWKVTGEAPNAPQDAVALPAIVLWPIERGEPHSDTIIDLDYALAFQQAADMFRENELAKYLSHPKDISIRLFVHSKQALLSIAEELDVNYELPAKPSRFRHGYVTFEWVPEDE